MSSVIVSGASTGANVGMAVGTAVGKSLVPQTDVHLSSQSRQFGFTIPKANLSNAEASTDSQGSKSLAQEIKRSERRLKIRKAAIHRTSTES